MMPIPSIAQLSATMRWCIALLRRAGGESFRASTSMVTRSCCGEPCLCFALRRTYRMVCVRFVVGLYYGN